MGEWRVGGSGLYICVYDLDKMKMVPRWYVSMYIQAIQESTTTTITHHPSSSLIDQLSQLGERPARRGGFASVTTPFVAQRGRRARHHGITHRE